MLKSTPAQKKYTTAGFGGCDQYELCKWVFQSIRECSIVENSIPKEKMHSNPKYKIEEEMQV